MPEPTSKFGGRPVSRFGGRPTGMQSMSATMNTADRVAQGREEIEYGKLTNRARIEQQVGAGFDPSAEYDDFFGRFNLARSGTPSEKASKLRAKMPDADVRLVETNQGENVVFRPQGEELYRGIDAPGGGKLSDFGDIAGSLLNFENAAATGTAVATGGAGLGARLGLQALSSAGGNILDTGVEKLQELFTGQDIQQSTLSDVGSEATASAALGAVGEGVGSGISRVVGGKGVFKAKPAAQQGDEFAERIGLERLTPDQKNEITARKGAQVRASTNIMDASDEAQIQSLENVLTREFIQPQELELFDDKTLNAVVKRAEKELVGGFNEKNLKLDGTDVTKAGRSLSAGRDKFNKAMRERTSRLYDQAAEVISDDVGFNTKDIVAKAREIQKAIPVPQTEEGAAAVVGAPKGELKRLTDIMVNLPEQANGPQAYEALKEIRTQLYELAQTTPEKPVGDAQTRLASVLHNAVSEALDNPAGNASDAFRTLNRAAANSHKRRVQVMEANAFQQIAREADPYALAQGILNNGTFSDFTLLKRTMEPQKFAQLQDSMEALMLQEPTQINEIFRRYKGGFSGGKDPRALNALMPKGRQEQFALLGNAAERLADAPSVRVLGAQGDLGQRALQIFQTGSDESFDQFISALAKETGKDKAAKQTILSGVMEQLVNKNTVPKDGRLLLDVRGVISDLTPLVQTGRLSKIASPQQVQDLIDLDNYASLITSLQNDAGSSLQAASLASGLFDITDPVGMPKSLLDLYRNAMWGRIFTAKTGLGGAANKSLFGSPRGENKVLSGGIRGTSVLMAQMANDLSDASSIIKGEE